MAKSDEKLLHIYLLPYLFFLQKTTFQMDVSGGIITVVVVAIIIIISTVNTEMVTEIAVSQTCICTRIFMLCIHVYMHEHVHVS